MRIRLLSRLGNLNGIRAACFASAMVRAWMILRLFVLTVTLPYVAREFGKSVSFAEISKYVEQNADKLKATARFAKIGRGFTTHTLE